MNPSRFYQDKTIRFVVGFQRGGTGWEAFAELVARHFGKHIPGSPQIATEYKHGNGSLDAARWVYAEAPRDGLLIAFFQPRVVGISELDSGTFGWIGAASRVRGVCAVMGFAGVRNFEELRSASRRIKFGINREGPPGLPLNEFPKDLKEMTGAPIDLLPNYKGTPQVLSALERREIDAVCFDWGAMRFMAEKMFDATGDDRLIPILVERPVDDPRLAGLPTLSEVIRWEAMDEAKRSAVRAKLERDHATDANRAMAAPPSVPADRLEILRSAFASMMADPDFQQDAAKNKLSVDHVSARELELQVRTAAKR